ncbi:hypothetical protein FRC10_004316 [Ceratobasidium sp. 414]|nr:hypothetical protein FRC10_004316 [Ceratobasidium sp. 414]
MDSHHEWYRTVYGHGLDRTWSQFPPMDMPPIQPIQVRAVPESDHIYARTGRTLVVSRASVPCIDPALLSRNTVGQDGQYMSDYAHNGPATRAETPDATSKRQSDHPTRPAPERPLRRSQRPHCDTTKTRSHKTTMTPVEAFGHLPKGQWKFFQTSQAVLDQVKRKPGGKQLDACQYINPATEARCYLSKCHDMDGRRGFPIDDLEDYIRHLWVHRNLERMASGDVAPAFLTSWDDEVLDAQKALDDANGVVYPDRP